MSNTVLPILFLFLALHIGLQSGVYSQLLNPSNAVHIMLSDSTELDVYPAWQQPNHYYYLPVNLHISIRKDSIPEFSFLSFRENDDSPISGGLMHLLLSWGLNKAQIMEAETQLWVLTDSSAKIYGAAPLELLDTKDGFLIQSENELADILRRSLKSVGQPPVHPGGKLAASFMFSADDAVKIESALQQRELFGDSRISLVWKLGLQGGTFVLNRSLQKLLYTIPQ